MRSGDALLALGVFQEVSGKKGGPPGSKGCRRHEGGELARGHIGDFERPLREDGTKGLPGVQFEGEEEARKWQQPVQITL